MMASGVAIPTLLSELLLGVISEVVVLVTKESASLLAKMSVGKELDGLRRSKETIHINM